MTFEDVVGQDHINRTLRNSLKTGRIRHAYLFSGPRGTGKTTTARLLAKAVNCTNDNVDIRPCNDCPACHAVNEGRYLDLIEIDAATHTGVDDVRDLREKIAFVPGEGRYKVYIIDEVHRFSGSAFDALLKTLEEPPDHAIFVLATTEIDKVPATIKSRCLQFEFRRISLMEVADRLQLIAENEGLQIDRSALELIARQGTGSARDSISLLDQIVSDPEEHITLEIAQRILGTANTRAVKELADALVDQDIARGLHIINVAVDSGSDPRQFGQQVVEHLRNMMLAQTSSADLIEASAEDQALFAEQAQAMSREALLKAIRAFNDAVNDYKGGWQPQLALELALIESIRGAEAEFAQPMQYFQQPAAQATTQPTQSDLPPAVATAPGSPPLVSTSAVQGKWMDMLRVLNHLNQSAPAVLQHFRVQRVDGNVVYLMTDNELFYKRLQHADKIRIVEHALLQVHNERLLVKLIMVDNMEHAGSVSTNAQPDVTDDPVLSMGIELGGKIREDSGDDPS